MLGGSVAFPPFPTRRRFTSDHHGKMRYSPLPDNPSCWRSPAGIMAAANASRVVIQDVRPFAESLEWELGQSFYSARGSQAFISDFDPVPYTVNNDGEASYNAAEVVFASLVACPPEAPRILVLELGIGLGLFARYFLDRFRQLCLEFGRDFYDRLWYIAADASESMLVDACRHGIFADHAGHALLRVIDARRVRDDLAGDPMLAEFDPLPLRGVFCNYVLDCLPAHILKFVHRSAASGDVVGSTDNQADVDVQSLHLRSCLARHVRLEEHTPLSLAEIRQLANSADPALRRRLTPLFDLFSVEYEFLTIDPASIPFGELAVAMGTSRGAYTVHNSGAMEVLFQLTRLLEPGGLVLVNDYGYGADHPSFQRGFTYETFASSTALGLNFPLLDDFCACMGLESHATDRQMDQYYTRLIGRDIPPAVVTRFREVFGQERYRYANEWIERVDALRTTQCAEAEADAYFECLRRTPHNWTYLHCAGGFLLKRQGNPQAALALARQALALNPACSSDLWDLVGECLAALGRKREARHAFERALRINPSDLRGLYQSAKLALDVGGYRVALERIAQGLATKSGREGLYDFVELQGRVLDELRGNWTKADQRIEDRVGKTARFESPVQVDRKCT